MERGFNRFDDVVINDIAFLNYVYDTVYVLPIVSDPTSEDGDEDDIHDLFDYAPLQYANKTKCWLHRDINIVKTVSER